MERLFTFLMRILSFLKNRKKEPVTVEEEVVTATEETVETKEEPVVEQDVPETKEEEEESVMVIEEVTGGVIKQGMIGDWNVTNTIGYLSNNGCLKRTASTGKCWKYVKAALLNDKFNDVPVKWQVSACDAENWLPTVGFAKIDEGVFKADTKIPDDQNQVIYGNPQNGDITVFRKCTGHPHGHIHMWVDNKWVSDFSCQMNRIARNCTGGYTVWRYTGKGKNGIKS